MQLTVDFGGHRKKLLESRFSLIGNVYFADIWNRVGYIPSLGHQSQRHSNSINIGIGTDADFVIGRMVTTRFFRDKRAILHAQCGPFRTTRELTLAETRLLGQRIRHLSPSPKGGYYCGADESLVNNRNEVLDAATQLYHVASSRIYPPGAGDGPEDTKVLCHDDLSSINTLVDPETYQPTGIVD